MTRTPSAPPPPSLLALLSAQVGARVVTLALVVVSGAITLVAAAFAVYAQLKTSLSPAAAAALTALAFGMTTAVIGGVGATLLKARARRIAAERAAAGRRLAKVTPLLEVGALALTALAQAAARRRR